MAECLGFQIGTGAADLRELFYQGIPNPDHWTYTPYSRTETAGDGTLRGYGFGTATWEWDVLSQMQVNRLLAYITANQASGNVRINTPTDRGNKRTFDVFDCVLARIVDGNGKSMISQTQAPIFSGVTATFTHLVEA